MIAIFDYGAGNLRSVENTLGEIGCAYELVRDAGGSAARREDHPARRRPFRPDDARARRARRCAQPLRERIGAGVPFLGICLGLQALFEASEEAPEVRGLGIFPGTVQRFPASARVPHMGWNELELRPNRGCFAASASGPIVYFAHSYYVPDVRTLSATCNYGLRYTAVLEAGQHLRRAVPSRKIRARWACEIVRNFVEL